MKILNSFIFSMFFLSINILQGQNMETNLSELKKDILSEFNSIEGKFAFAFQEIGNPSNEINVNINESFHAASTMKTPVMMEVYKQANEGKFRLTDPLFIKNEFHSIVDSSIYHMELTEDGGEELYKFIDKKRTIYELVYDMITVSSNLATNILIELVGEKNVTASMRQIGADKINVLRGVEDIKAYYLGLNNTTTAADLLIIFKSIAEWTWIDPKICDEMISILLDQKFKTKIPKLLPEEVKVAHKTGSISRVEHDSGIVFLPDGRKYVIVILSKELSDVNLGSDVISKVSRKIYDYMLKTKSPN